MVSAYNTPWVICTKYVLSNYFTTLGMVRECIYRGFCPEMFSCGYHKTEEYQKELKEYREGINE